MWRTRTPVCTRLFNANTRHTRVLGYRAAWFFAGGHGASVQQHHTRDGNYVFSSMGAACLIGRALFGFSATICRACLRCVLAMRNIHPSRLLRLNRLLRLSRGAYRPTQQRGCFRWLRQQHQHQQTAAPRPPASPELPPVTDIPESSHCRLLRNAQKRH
jgi:hypothetical protein